MARAEPDLQDDGSTAYGYTQNVFGNHVINDGSMDTIDSPFQPAELHYWL